MWSTGYWVVLKVTSRSCGHEPDNTHLAIKTVKNALTGLRKQEVVEPTGEVENRTEQVRLSVPASLSIYKDGDGDDNATLAQVLINERGEAEF